ncbi:MAG: c-type cytochrome [Planctomycetota bacterium]
MKRFILALVLTSIALAPSHAIADEAASLSLLVETLHATDDVEVQAAVLTGMLSGLEGRRGVASPKGWQSLKNKLGPEESLRDLMMRLSQIFGDETAIQQALEIVQNPEADAGARRTALRALLAQQNREASSHLEALLEDPTLELDAIRGYAAIENATAPGILLARYEGLRPEAKRAVIETLSSRKRYAQALFAALKSDRVPKEDIPVHAARSLRLLLGFAFEEFFGEIRSLADDRGQQLAKYKALCSPDAVAKASAPRGRAVFQKTCASCHLLYGVGGKIGPDLTGSNRANLDYILLNSVDPSYDVPDGYKMEIIQTFDGRLISGVIAEEDARRVVLKTVEQPKLVIAKSDIEARKTSTKSMMPDGQLDQMKPQEVVDLIKYLRTTEQVELPSES